MDKLPLLISIWANCPKINPNFFRNFLILSFCGRSASLCQMVKKKAKPVVIPRPDLNAIEADIAYFEARLSFARRGADTAYKQAQRRAYQALSDSLAGTLKKLRKQ